MLIRCLPLLYVVIGLLLGCSDSTPPDKAPPQELDTRPNILLIVADDLGVSDLGVFGSEIDTPNLDSLAASGVTLSNFYAAPTCSPTRSMLLTGVDNHLAGLGNMGELTAPNQQGKPGYEGYLHQRVLSLPELLADAGYNTYLSGKWHLGFQLEHAPHNRGFKRSFSVLPGWAHHLEHKGPSYGADSPLYVRDGEVVETLPEDFFSTDYFTDQMMEYLDEARNEQKPFFAYLTYTAPHWPLQAPDEYLEKYRGFYDAGYDYWRDVRFRNTQEKGLAPNGLEPPGRNKLVTPWNELSLEEQAFQAASMSAYAAMVDSLDHNIGRILQHLEQTGVADNTLVMFISDNGAEGNSMEGYVNSDQWNNSLGNIGRVGSFVVQGPGWGQVSASPWSWWKAYSAEGGIRVPALVRIPGSMAPGTNLPLVASVKDITPTLLEFAGLSHPGTRYQGRDILPMTGLSFLSALRGENIDRTDYTLGVELFGRRAVRRGPWKLRWIEHPRESGEWELFNLRQDPLERNNLASTEPEKLAEMLSAWNKYVADNGVIIPDGSVAY